MARSERRRFLSVAIAFLSPVGRGPRDEAFANGLRELGYVDGRNLDLEMRFAEGRPDRLSELVAEPWPYSRTRPRSLKNWRPRSRRSALALRKASS